MKIRDFALQGPDARSHEDFERTAMSTQTEFERTWMSPQTVGGMPDTEDLNGHPRPVRIDFTRN